MPRLDPGLLTCHFIRFGHFRENLIGGGKKRIDIVCDQKREKCRQIGSKPLPQTPITSKDFIQTSYHAISSIHGHFQHILLRGAGGAKMTATVEKSRKKMSNLCTPQPSCSINIPRHDTGLIPCYFNHLGHLQQKMLGSAKKRVDVDCSQTAKNVVNWPKIPSTCSIHMPRLDPGLLTCHFIHFWPFPRESDRQWKKAYRVRLRPNCKKCRQVGPKPLPHAPITFKDFIQNPCRAISSISSHFQKKSDLRWKKAYRRRLRPNREKCCQIGPKPLSHAPITSPDLILASYHAISSICGHFQYDLVGGAGAAAMMRLQPNHKK